MCYKAAIEREFSAGGMLVRRLRGRWWVAAIRPQGRPPGLWALPKPAGCRSEDAPRLLAYGGERETARKALAALEDL